VQKLLTVTGVWATFEGEKQGPIDTKLNRRGFSTGRAVTTKAKKKAGEEDAEAPAGDAAAAEPPAAEAAPADDEKPEDAKAEDAEAEDAEAEDAG